MITCFELNERECRIVTLSHSKSGIQIHHAFTVEFPEMPPQDTKNLKVKSDLIRETLKKYRIKVKRGILIVPKQSVTVRHSSLPSSVDSEIAQMAHFEAERHIPFNAERHIISHHILRKEGVSGSKVLIAAVDSPIVEEMIQILSQAGINPEVSDISSLSLFNLFLASNPNLKDDITIGLINIGHLTTDITLIRENLVIYTRSALHGTSRLIKELNDILKPQVPFDRNLLDKLDLSSPELSFYDSSSAEMSDKSDRSDMSDVSDVSDVSDKTVQPTTAQEMPERQTFETLEKIAIPEGKSEQTNPKHPSRVILQQWLMRLLQEIRRTYEFARREFDCPPIQKAFISGEITRCQSFLSFFSENLNVTADFNPGINMIQPFPKAKEGEIPQNLMPYAEAIGGACRELIPGTLKINLLPPSYVKSKLSKVKRQNILFTSLLVIFALVIAGVYLKERTDYRNKMLTWYQNYNKKNVAEVDKLVDMEKKLKIIKREVDNKRSALTILDKISSFPYIPANVTMTEFSYIGDESVNIGGHSLEIKDLNQFLSDLENSGFFSSVSLKQRAPDNLPNRERKIQVFEINCFFEKKTEQRGAK